MFRALIELLIVVLVVIVARAVLTSIMKGIANASASAFRSQMQSSADASGNAPPQTPKGGDLHKDPICGTYVAESTPFRQHILGQIFYYCSESCREKHALAVR
jgi:YHS domain-containing protein